MHIYIFLFFWPAPPVARIAGQKANSNPRSFTEDRCEGVSMWPMRPPGADSSAEAGLQRPASNVKSPGSATRPPKGPPQAVCRDDTQTSAQLGKPNSGGSYRTHIPAGHSGCPLWTLVVLTPAAAGASSSQDPFRAWVEGVPDVSTHKASSHQAAGGRV